MLHFATHDLTNLLSTYGYWAVLGFVAIESMGVPFPGETMLLIASIYAGTTHHLAIPYVIASAAAGAILGDNIGYWIGREGGFRFLKRFGRYVHIEDRRLKVGQYLFREHGGKVVFFGRFAAVLRAFAAFLAGANHMPWPRFLVFNAAGGIVWATVFGMAGYLLGDNANRVAGPVGLAALALAVVLLIAALLYIRRNEQRLQDVAEEALPGPLVDYQAGDVQA